MQTKLIVPYKPRESFIEYWNIDELPIGELPYNAIQKALRNEEYFRKFTPTYCRNDLMIGHKSALLYWYPYYVDTLYELSSKGMEYSIFFNGIGGDMLSHFTYLFPDTIIKLNKVLKLKKNHLDEVGL